MRPHYSPAWSSNRRKSGKHQFRFVRSTWSALPVATLNELEGLFGASVIDA